MYFKDFLILLFVASLLAVLTWLLYSTAGALRQAGRIDAASGQWECRRIDYGRDVEWECTERQVAP